VSPSYTRIGADLALTRATGTPSGVALESADSWGSVDLAVGPGGRWARRPVGDLQDLGVVQGRENLGQALIVRLLTPLGGLAALGHPGYGSRLVELVGRTNDETTRNLARLYVLQALAQEGRIHPPRDLSVSVAEGRSDTLLIRLSVVPVGDDDPLALALEVAL
jgi:phage baseplate assembly protein W